MAQHIGGFMQQSQYTLKDHLGNARINFRANGTSVTFLEEHHYYPFGMKMEGIGAAPVTSNKYMYNSKELNDDQALELYDYGARWYDSAVGRWWSVDPITMEHADQTPYNYVINNPLAYIDPMGLDTMTPIIDKEFYDAGNLPEVTINSGSNNSSDANDEGYMVQTSIFGWFIDFAEHYWNDGLDNMATAVWAYDGFDNSAKRKFFYESTKKIKKITNGRINIKPGRQLFQPLKRLSGKATRLGKKLGPIGIGLTITNIYYEAVHDTWDAHTIVDVALLAATATASLVGAPVVLIGIGIYGAADLFFDLDEKIDNLVGRKSDIWKPENDE